MQDETMLQALHNLQNKQQQLYAGVMFADVMKVQLPEQVHRVHVLKNKFT